MNKQFFLLLSFVSVLFGVHPEESFLQGNELFAKGEFKGAIELYEKVENPSSLLLMNIGVAHFNLEEYAQARLFFVRAYNVGTMKIRKKINGYQELINSRLEVSKEKTKADRVEEWLQAIPLSVIQLWILICFGLLFYGLYRKKGGAFQSFVCAFLFLGSAFWLYHFKQDQQKEAVIMNKTDLYAGPERSFLKKNVISLGTVVCVLDKQKGMTEITLAKQRGWVFSEDLKLV
jgi:tetratricopeptide (TPR) repeat protein